MKRRRRFLYEDKRQISTEKSTRAFPDEAVKNSNSQFDSYLHFTEIFLADSDRHKPKITGTNVDLQDTIFISGAAYHIVLAFLILNELT